MSMKPELLVRCIDMETLREIMWNKNRCDEFKVELQVLSQWNIDFSDDDLLYMSEHGIREEVFLKAQKAAIINNEVTLEDLFDLSRHGLTDQIALFAFVELLERQTKCTCTHLSLIAQQGKSVSVASEALKALLVREDATSEDILFVAQSGRADDIALTAMKALLPRADTTIELLDQVRTFGKTHEVRVLARNARKILSTDKLT